MKLIDRIGQRYGRLVVTSRAPNKSETDTNARWNCKCDCGRMVVTYGQDLARGKCKSCGCLNAERIFKHGMSRTNVHLVWRMMHQRCENPNNDSYHNYGARGITVDPAWKDFAAFHADMGNPPDGYTIERKDNDGPYCKENCMWAPMSVQSRNKRTNRNITYNGKTQTLTEWAEEIGLSQSTLSSRINQYGWSIERAMTPLSPPKGN